MEAVQSDDVLFMADMEMRWIPARQRAGWTKRQRTRDRLMQVLIDDSKDRSLTVEEICRRANVSTRTFYGHFENTEQLAGLALARETIYGSAHIVRGAYERRSSPYIAWERFAELVDDLANRYRHYGGERHSRPLWDRPILVGTLLVRLAQLAGQVRDDVPAEVLAATRVMLARGIESDGWTGSRVHLSSAWPAAMEGFAAGGTPRTLNRRLKAPELPHATYADARTVARSPANPLSMTRSAARAYDHFAKGVITEAECSQRVIDLFGDMPGVVLLDIAAYAELLRRADA